MHQALEVAGTEISFADHFKAQADQNQNDDQDLSLRNLMDDESEQDEPEKDESKDASTDDILDLDDSDDDARDDRENQDDDDEALKLAKSKQDAVDSALSRLRRPIHQVRVIGSFGGEDGPPDNQSSDDLTGTLITDSGSSIPRFQRKTICFSHRPLYCQDPNLERCGNGHGCLTNAYSAVHFVSCVAVLPYTMVKQPPNCPVHSGGDCRCGQSIPTELDFFPIDLHAVATQAAAVAGISFLLL